VPVIARKVEPASGRAQAAKKPAGFLDHAGQIANFPFGGAKPGDAARGNRRRLSLNLNWCSHRVKICIRAMANRTPVASVN
jgi:hypothetical protein